MYADSTPQCNHQPDGGSRCLICGGVMFFSVFSVSTGNPLFAEIVGQGIADARGNRDPVTRTTTRFS